MHREMVRSCGDKKSLKRGPWTAEEDDKLLAFIHHHGHGSWRSLPSKAGDYFLILYINIYIYTYNYIVDA